MSRWQPNARGRLGNDRPHIFRATGNVDVLRTGLVIAASFQYLTGKPWDPTRPGIVWNGSKWVGDVPDFKPDSPPGQFGAFIMNAEGVGRLYAPALGYYSAG